MTCRYLQRAPYSSHCSMFHPLPLPTAHPSRPSTRRLVVDSLVALAKYSICQPLPTYLVVCTARPERRQLVVLNSAPLAHAVPTRIKIVKALANAVHLALSLVQKAPNRLVSAYPFVATELIRRLVSCRASSVRATASHLLHLQEVLPNALPVQIQLPSLTNRPLHLSKPAARNVLLELILRTDLHRVPLAHFTFSNPLRARCRVSNARPQLRRKRKAPKDATSVYQSPAKKDYVATAAFASQWLTWPLATVPLDSLADSAKSTSTTAIPVLATMAVLAEKIRAKVTLVPVHRATLAFNVKRRNRAAHQQLATIAPCARTNRDQATLPVSVARVTLELTAVVHWTLALPNLAQTQLSAYHSNRDASNASARPDGKDHFALIMWITAPTSPASSVPTAQIFWTISAAPALLVSPANVAR